MSANILPFIETKNNQYLKSLLKEHFFIESNNAGGNCMFHAIANSLYGEDSKHVKIRKLVSNFYASFVPQTELYNVDSLQYKIAFSLLYDNIDDDGRIHSEVIGEDGVYANYTDLMVCAYLFKLTIVMFDYGAENVYMNKLATKIEISNEPSICNIFIRFINNNHFEAMIPKFANKNLLNKYVYGKKNEELLVKEYINYTFRDSETDIYRGFYLVKHTETRLVKKMTEYEIVTLM